MIWGLLADVVMVVHLGFIAFVVVGGFLALRRRWLLWPHLAAVGWSIVGIGFGIGCPLTDWEKHLLELADQQGYEGGFIDHYLEGVIYPESGTNAMRSAIAGTVVASYVLLARQGRHARSSSSTALAR